MDNNFEYANCIGILGGTFNPVHKGHVMLAKSAKEQFPDIDNIVVVPNNTPAYKDKDEIITGNHRINMLNLAFEQLPYAYVSDIEIKRGGLTYTYDTLVQLKGINPKLEIYFIIGADSMYSFEKWFHFQEVLKLCTLLVATRDCDDIELISYVNDFKNRYPFANIFLLKTQNIDISSSELRDNISNTMYQSFVPKNVMDYIKKNKLYGWK